MDRRTIKTKRAIKHALIQLMTEKDVSKITVKELAETADISRKTFYVHYGQFIDVLSEIDDDIFTRLHAELAEEKWNEGRPDFAVLFKHLNNIIQEDEQFFKLLVGSSYCNTLSAHIQKLLEEEIASALQNNITVAPELFALSIEYISAGATSLIIEWLRSDSKVTAEEVTDCIAGIMSNGFYAYINSEA